MLSNLELRMRSWKKLEIIFFEMIQLLQLIVSGLGKKGALATLINQAHFDNK